jgi:hypothetical protein
MERGDVAVSEESERGAQTVANLPAADKPILPPDPADPPPTRLPRPVLGPALTVFGVLLWAFVSFGQFTTSWFSGAPLDEGTAIAFVTLATLSALFFATQKSRRALPVEGTRGFVVRAARIGIVALLFWGLVILVATVIGSASMGRSADVPIVSSLWVVAAAAVVAGPRLTLPLPQRPLVTPARSLGIGALWFGAAALTLGACVELLNQ